MKNEREIRWLQLSDLHMFQSTEMEEQKKALYRQFGKRMDYVLITGDLHQYGKDYSMPLQLLNEMVEKMGLRKRDVIIVPGNHDVSASEKRKELLENIDKGLEQNADIYLPNINKLYQAFQKYKNFLGKFYGEDIKKPELQKLLENRMFICDGRLAVVCVNTALASDENHYKPQIVDVNGLGKLENKGLPCVAIMHHDYYAVSDEHKPYINANFRRLGVSAIMSGHKHKNSKSTVDLGDGVVIPHYCCGKSVSEPGDLWSDVGVIEYCWKTGQGKVRVVPYEWDGAGMAFKVSTKFEEEKDAVINSKGQITLKHNFVFRFVKEEKEKTIKKPLGREEIKEMGEDFSSFYEDVQKDYLDGILDSIGDDREKFRRAVDIMERIITYKGRRLDFDKIIDAMISCEKKVILAINGLQGTGKSTFLSLVYYELKRRFGTTGVYPILIDLHALDNYSKKSARQTLLGHLERIDALVRAHQDKKFLLLFDGADDYIRKTTDLEGALYTYVKKNNMNNFAFCIGSADNLPDEMCKKSKLQGFSREAIYKLEANKIEKTDDEKIVGIMKDLLAVYSFSIEEKNIDTIKKCANAYKINKIDYRTLLIVLRVFSANTNVSDNYQLGNYFYDYYLMEMDDDESELFRHAGAAYRYIILKEQDALRTLKHSRIIYNNGITIDFLLAYYFISIIKNGDKDIHKILNSNFVFTASVNKFIKDLLLNKYSSEQAKIVEKMIDVYEESDISMQSQICYTLGRVKEDNAKEKARDFLIDKWGKIYEVFFEDDILKIKRQDIKTELVLFRTISVSLIWLGYDKEQERFLRCLLLNEKLNQINRGFHLEYYEDKAYMNGVSPTYIDDANISVDKTMQHLINNINKGFSKSGEFNKSVCLDVVTLFSIYQYRMENENVKERYEKILLDMADKILASVSIQSRTIRNYVTTVRKLLGGKPYRNIMQEINRAKVIRREGWIRRGVNGTESIADHMHGCCMLGKFLLPNNIQQCIDYNISDIENYVEYSKRTILDMLMIHDLAEVRTGDIVVQEKGRKDIDEENSFFNGYEFLCSFPHIYGLGNEKKLWDEFLGNATINAKVANDLDKIEAVLQAYVYKENGNAIDMDEWTDYARKNINTTLGKKILHFVMKKVIG